MKFMGVPEQNRPYCPEVRADSTCWEIAKAVSTRLKQAGLLMAAQEFRRQVEYADGDNGMLFTIALHYIRIPGQEPSDG